ncbi:hypothetical protein TNCV_3492141 [Trichonephila clavipes]|nr:hypothetical protein TNCV_3492141 [Trichonephila clavipes]
MGSKPGEVTDVNECIGPSRHGGTQNSSRAASPLVRLVEGEERWDAPVPSPRCSLSKLGGKRAKSYCYLHGAQSYDERQASLSSLP